MDIPRPDNFNETYLYEGKPNPCSRTNIFTFSPNPPRPNSAVTRIWNMADGRFSSQSSWNATWRP